MNLWFRFIKVLITALFRTRLAPLGESVIRLRVWPNDLDLNGHMNNGRYLTLMDLGRFDLMFRTGMGRAAIRGGWAPIVGSATIRFRRPLNLFQAFELRSRVIGWDEKWFFIEQTFCRNQEFIGSGWIKGLLKSRKGLVSTREVLAALNFALPSPDLPPGLRLWLQSEGSTTPDSRREG